MPPPKPASEMVSREVGSWVTRRGIQDSLPQARTSRVIYFEVMPRPRAAPTAADTGVEDRVGAALRLWAMCAFTRCPAARAAHRLSSPARTEAAMIRDNWRAFSPGVVGWEPRTPSRSSMADCASRMVPPPIVPTSMEGIDTAIWRLPLLLLVGLRISIVGQRRNDKQLPGRLTSSWS